MSIPRHVIRGLWARKRERRVLWVGNSIHQPTVNRNVLVAIVAQSDIGIKGGVMGLQSTVGMPTGLIDLTMTNAGNSRPGENAAGGTRRFNLRQTTLLSGDMTDFSTAFAVRVNGTWEENRSVKMGILLITDPAATGYTTSPGPSLQIRNRAGAWSGPLTFIQSPVSLQQSPATLITRETSFFPVGAGGQGQRAALVAWNGTQAGQVRVGGVSIESDNPEGLFISYCGNGSWGSTHHATETGATITADPPTYDAAYSDAALTAEYALWKYNQIVVDVTANDVLTLPATLRANLSAIRARHWAAADAAGVARPDVLYWTQYDLSDTIATFDAMADIAFDLAKADAKTECFDFCRLKRATSGLWSAWQATELVDGVHPAVANSVLRDQMASTFYANTKVLTTKAVSPRWLNPPPTWV